MYLYIKNSCFNCEKTIFSERLKHSVPCENDLTEEEFLKLKNLDRKEKIDMIYKILKEKNRLFKFKNLYELEKETEKFIKFFNSKIGSDPWSVQITWFKRLYKNNSFTMIAPTGTGKTTFIIISSIYFAKKGKRIYIILPTTVLVEQVYERLLDYSDGDIRILAYLRRNRKEIKEKIVEGNFDILVTSNQFLSKNFDILRDKKFDIIFVDDVDAFFRGSKNIERVLQLLGFTDDDISIAYEMIRAKRQGDLDTIKKLNEKLEKIKKKKHGVLILSSATGRVQGQRVKLYKELLNFTVGMGTTKIRNIIDTYMYPKRDIKEEVYELVKKLKDGILIFVTREQGTEFAKELYKYLSDRGINVGLVISGYSENNENIRKFANKELNVLIGVAHFYGLLVRGLDLPTRVKYIIFTGIPKIRINLTKREKNIGNLMILANILKDILDEKESKEIQSLIRKLKNAFRRMSAESLKILSEAFEFDKKLDGWLELVRQNVILLYEKVSSLLDNKEILEKLKDHPDVSLEVKENIWLRIPDIKTYIQASGRSSRLYAGGITKGLSIIIVDDEKLLKALERKMSILFS